MKPAPPEKTAPAHIALTFDDAVSNHATFVGPLLARYGFGATFYITEFAGEGGDRFDLDKRQYMDWQQIAGLHAMGFEIGNHTGHHPGLSALDTSRILAEIEIIEQRCEAQGLPRPLTFAYPGGNESIVACELLKQKGYLGARGCRKSPYHASEDSVWSIPSFVITQETEGLFDEALALAVQGESIVFTFYGVPDCNHPWVTTLPETFQRMMEALHQTGLPVVSLKALIGSLQEPPLSGGFTENSTF